MRTATWALLYLFITTWVQAQDESGYHRMVRIYEDNDFMNIFGNGADKGYSNGTRLDLFYVKQHPSLFFIDRWMPKAGDSSVNTFGWGIMQTIITPYDLHLTIPDKNDYPYSGALFALHTLQSSNPIKKYNLQTEWMIGVSGPPSLARQAQTFVHRLVNFERPRGWDHQLPAGLLLNLALSGEKLLAHHNHHIELIGGGQVFGGTALNGAGLHALLRIGKMQPYFNGYLSQYTQKQFYFVLRPSVDWMLTNAFLEGMPFKQHRTDNRHFVGQWSYGIVLGSGPVSISFMQVLTSALIKGVGGQTIGNLSLHMAW